MTRTVVAGVSAPAQYVMPDRFLRLSQVTELIGFQKTAVYKMVKSGTFPAPSKPGGSASRWSEREVLAWLAECLTRRAN